MLYDALGNELKKGQRVHVVLSSPYCYGDIIEISPGGISLVKGTNHNQRQEIVTQGLMEVLVKVSIPIDPRQQQVAIVHRVVRPEDSTKLLV